MCIVKRENKKEVNCVNVNEEFLKADKNTQYTLTDTQKCYALYNCTNVSLSDV